MIFGNPGVVFTLVPPMVLFFVIAFMFTILAGRSGGARRDGNRMYYRLIDPCVGGLIELGLCLLGHDPSCTR